MEATELVDFVLIFSPDLYFIAPGRGLVFLRELEEISSLNHERERRSQRTGHLPFDDSY